MQCIHETCDGVARDGAKPALCATHGAALDAILALPAKPERCRKLDEFWAEARPSFFASQAALPDPDPLPMRTRISFGRLTVEGKKKKPRKIKGIPNPDAFKAKRKPPKPKEEKTAKTKTKAGARKSAFDISGFVNEEVAKIKG